MTGDQLSMESLNSAKAIPALKLCPGEETASRTLDPATPSYYLSPRIFVRPTRQGAVILHLDHNKYYGLTRTDVQYLAKIVHNWPSDENIQFTSASPPERAPHTNDLISSLLESHILQCNPPEMDDIRSAPISLEGDLVSVGDELTESAPTLIKHVVTFVWSLLSATIRLHLFPFTFTVAHVYRRKLRATYSGYIFDPSRIAKLIYVFRRIRPYLFVAEGHCLLHALTLVNFLSIHGEFPCWVLGIRTDPWGAHSWVQQGVYLLDTNPEKVCSYEPILSV